MIRKVLLSLLLMIYIVLVLKKIKKGRDNMLWVAIYSGVILTGTYLINNI